MRGGPGPADAGTVALVGADRRAGTRTLTRMRRSRIGFVFQSFNLLPALTAQPRTCAAAAAAGERPGGRRARRSTGRVGREDHGRRRPGQLSGGQQQRVAMPAPDHPAEVVFADEPTGRSTW